MTGKRQKHARLVSLLDAMIDEELAKPEAEQDIAAVGEWNAMIDRLTSGAYRQTAAQKRALLREMKSHRGEKAPKRIRRPAVWIAAAALTALILLPAGAYARNRLGNIDRILLLLSPQMKDLEPGEILEYHEENVDVYIVNKEDYEENGSPESLAELLGKRVLKPGWLPEGIEARTIISVPLSSYTFVPWQDRFGFTMHGEEYYSVYPETLTAEICGEEVEFRYFQNTDGYGGNFLYGGFCYTLNFRSLEEAVRFLENLVPVDPRGSEKPASLHKA